MRRAALLLLAVAGCVAIPHPEAVDLPAAQAIRAGVTLPDLAAGRDLYVRKCSGCHGLFAPAAFDDPTWRHHIGEMRERARLAPAELDAIWLYVATLNDRGGIPRPGGAESR